MGDSQHTQGINQALKIVCANVVMLVALMFGLHLSEKIKHKKLLGRISAYDFST